MRLLGAGTIFNAFAFDCIKSIIRCGSLCMAGNAGDICICSLDRGVFMSENSSHTFHIPVMGIGFTIDTPVKVAQYGISSALSIVDDTLIEKMRKYYCDNLKIPFQNISNKIDDFRAERITAYLNLLNRIVRDKFEELKKSALEKGSELSEFLEMLPDFSPLKAEYKALLTENNYLEKVQEWIRNRLAPGSIDVNIVTKLDRKNQKNGEKLPDEYNDAMAALRGFAQSELHSSIIFSAGMNPKLYSYIERFDDFYPDENGEIRKKIIIKVSDYRSALIQGRFLARKGLWVSEFRIESGLNCGGHAFPTNGRLMGPILKEFRDNRRALLDTLFETFTKALKKRGRICPPQPPAVKFTAQGGVGTAEEHAFLLEHYNLDSVGWGTPFLLVPEAVNIDDQTAELLCRADEDDLYLSDISPLNVKFNSLKGNTKDQEKWKNIENGKPGSPCVKNIMVLNTEFGKPMCTASRQYQHLKLEQLEKKYSAGELTRDEFEQQKRKVLEKSCICVGLGTPALLANNIDHNQEGSAVSVCPGPDMAYFSQKVSLKQMIDHIYGRTNLVDRPDRPSLFIKELSMYLEYFRSKIQESRKPFTEKQLAYFRTFQENLQEGIAYYKKLQAQMSDTFQEIRDNFSAELKKFEDYLSRINPFQEEYASRQTS